PSTRQGPVHVRSSTLRGRESRPFLEPRERRQPGTFPPVLPSPWPSASPARLGAPAAAALVGRQDMIALRRVTNDPPSPLARSRSAWRIALAASALLWGAGCSRQGPTAPIASGTDAPSALAGAPAIAAAGAVHVQGSIGPGPPYAPDKP